MPGDYKSHELARSLGASTFHSLSERCAAAIYPMAPQAIREQSCQALDTVNHLRRLARRRTVDKVPTDMNSLVQTSLELVRREATARGFSIELDCVSPPSAVHIDPVLIEQVLLNLVRNAMDASTEVADASLIEVSLTRCENRLRVGGERPRRGYYCRRQSPAF